MKRTFFLVVVAMFFFDSSKGMGGYTFTPSYLYDGKTTATKSDKERGGGSVLECKKGYKLIDFHVVESQLGIKVPQYEGATSEIVEQHLSYVEKLMPGRGILLRNIISDFPNEIQYTSDTLLPSDDIGVIPVPQDCKPVIVILQRPDKWVELGYPRYLIHKPTWDALDANTKAGLLLHETLYRELLFRGRGSIASVQDATARIAARYFNDFANFDSHMRALDFQAYDVSQTWGFNPLLPGEGGLFVLGHRYFSLKWFNVRPIGGYCIEISSDKKELELETSDGKKINFGKRAVVHLDENLKVEEVFDAEKMPSVIDLPQYKSERILKPGGGWNSDGKRHYGWFAAVAGIQGQKAAIKVSKPLKFTIQNGTGSTGEGLFAARKDFMLRNASGELVPLEKCNMVGGFCFITDPEKEWLVFTFPTSATYSVQLIEPPQ